ncbi:MAG: hypothetical protein ACU0CO_08535 [Shimia sp.]
MTEREVALLRAATPSQRRLVQNAYDLSVADSALIDYGCNTDPGLGVQFTGECRPTPSSAVHVRRSFIEDYYIRPLVALPKLKRLTLVGPNIRDIEMMRHLVSVEELRLEGVSLDTVDPITPLQNLVRLSLRNNSQLDLGPLRILTKLVELNISGQVVHDLEFLETMSGLREFSAQKSIISAEARISKLNGLKRVSFANSRLERPATLGQIRNATTLDLRSANIDGAVSLAGAEIQSLIIAQTALTNLSMVSGVVGLRSIDARGARLEVISGMEDLRGLQALKLDFSPRKIDFTPILLLPELNSLYLSGAGSAEPISIENDRVAVVRTLESLVSYE